MALRKYAFGAAALSAARVFQLAASFAAVPVLTRILPPSDFGLVALALALVAITLYMADAGLSKSLVRTDTKETGIWSSAFWATLGFTGLMSLLILALAWPSAAFFNEPRLAPMMAALAVLPLIQGAQSIPNAELLQREKFITLAAAEFVSAIAGVVVAIWMALEGFGAWALVAQQLALWGVKALILVASTRFRPRLTFSMHGLRDHLIFARDTLGFAITSFIGRQADVLTIGKLLGAASLGIYSIAFRVMALPAHIVGGAIQSAIFPKFVQLAGDHAKLRQVVMMSTTAQAALVFPAMAGVAAASHAFFTLLLSDEWAEAALIFILLAPAGAIQTVTTLNGPLLQSIGRTGARLRLTVEFAVLWVIEAPLLALHSLEAVALGYSVLTLLYLPRQLALYLTPIGATILDYMKALAAPVALSAGVVVAHEILVPILTMSRWEEVLFAFAEVLAAYVVFIVLGWRRLREGVSQMRGIFAQQPSAQPAAPEAAQP